MTIFNPYFKWFHHCECKNISIDYIKIKTLISIWHTKTIFVIFNCILSVCILFVFNYLIYFNSWHRKICIIILYYRINCLCKFNVEEFIVYIQWNKNNYIGYWSYNIRYSSKNISRYWGWKKNIIWKEIKDMKKIPPGICTKPLTFTTF